MGYVIETGSNIHNRFVDRLPRASSATLADGHLSVYDDEGYQLAVYAPGQWLRAFRYGEVTPGTHNEGTFDAEHSR